MGGLGTKNWKITSNISKLEYFEAFCQKIQKLKIFVKKPKNHIFRGPKLKNSPFTLFSLFFVQNGHPLFAPPHGVKSLKWAPPQPRGTPSWNEGVLLFQIQYFPTTYRYLKILSKLLNKINCSGIKLGQKDE